MKNEIGVQIVCNRNTNWEEEFRKALDMELGVCQLCIWDMDIFNNPKHAENILSAVRSTGIKITSVWAGYDGPREWNFTYGPSTIGLVPAGYRGMRLASLKQAADFALKIGVNYVATHVGFLPEDPNDPNFVGTVGALRNLCKYLKNQGQYFLFETGQETPVTLLRAIHGIGMDNVGINMDTANLILYGKANSVDALEVFGKYVMETHIKDGFYPTDADHLGREVAVGQGLANIGAVTKKLSELGYTGAYIIEREIRGEEQIRDILLARDLLRKWMAENEQ